MKRLQNWTLLAVLALFSFACGDDDSDSNSGGGGPRTEFTVTEANGITTVEGSSNQNYTFAANKKYLLKGFVYVMEGATLNIEAGTIIKGDKASKGTLIIERGGKIMAEGTAQRPIVFTSAEAKGARKAGDWGGIIILGKAPINLPNNNGLIEGGVQRNFGGTDAADNSGSLKYVRIEFGGVALAPDNEINGLTLGGVGSGTTLDYIQVSHGGDDAFEWFGGTVNAKHLIAYKTVDDMFDTDNGYSGKLQFLVGLSDPNVADVSGSNGFESDNDQNGTDARPKTKAVFSNVSLFGPLATPTTSINTNFRRGMHIRRNSSISVHNSVVAGWPAGLLLDGAKTQANATGDTLKIMNTVIAGSSSPLTVEANSTYDVTTWFSATGKSNSIIADYATIGIANSFNQTTPSFLPAAGSTLATGAAFTGLTDFETVTYLGAFGTTDWTTGWANWDPQNTDY